MGEIKSRALETMILLETTPINNRPADDPTRIPASQGNMGPPVNLVPHVNVGMNPVDVVTETIATTDADLVRQLNVVPATSQPASQVNVALSENPSTVACTGGGNAAGSRASQSLPPTSIGVIATTGSCLNVEASSVQPVCSQQPCCIANSGHTVTTASHNIPRISTAEGSTQDMQLQLAVLAYNTLNDAIENDLQALEMETGTEAGVLVEAQIIELKEFAADIERRVKGEYTFSGEKCARLDIDNALNTIEGLTANTKNYLDRLRVVHAELRRNRASASRSPMVSLASPSASVIGDKSYKPFMKRLEPPTFSGKIEDWPEFRSIWQVLLADFPESVQVQHLKSKNPDAD